MNSQKWNKITIVPLAEDLKLFKVYLIDIGEEPAADLKINTVYCGAILLKSKRSGELKRIDLHTYKSSYALNQHYEEFEDVIRSAEKFLFF